MAGLRTALAVAGFVAVIGVYILGATAWLRQFARYRRGEGDKPREVSPVSSETLGHYLAAACGGLVGVLVWDGPAEWGQMVLVCLSSGYAMSFARFLLGWRSNWARTISYAVLFGFGALNAFVTS